MEPVVYYYREHKGWYGYWSEEDGTQVMDAVFAPTRDAVLIELGAIRSEAQKKSFLNSLCGLEDFQKELLMTVDEFKSSVECGALIDFDGFGNWATESVFEMCNDVSPKEYKNSGYQHPDWATHVVWYNR